MSINSRVWLTAGRKGLGLIATAVSVAGLLSTGLADDAKDRAYGEHLARECTTCHRLDGVDNGIPSIVGWPTEDFLTTMKFYGDGSRTNPVMVSVASSLSEKQLKALAAFFASVPKPEKRSPAAQGKRNP